MMNCANQVTFRGVRRRVAALCCAAALFSCAAAAAKNAHTKDPLEPARAALRTLQFDKAIALLSAAGKAGNVDAEYLLGLVYLNGVGTVADPVRGRSLLQDAAAHGHGAAAYVLAGEFAHEDPATAAGGASAVSRQWLERSANSGTTVQSRPFDWAGRCSTASRWAPPTRPYLRPG